MATYSRSRLLLVAGSVKSLHRRLMLDLRQLTSKTKLTGQVP
jgi:hypothetical protein